jgi:hypothetical protein
MAGAAQGGDELQHEQRTCLPILLPPSRPRTEDRKSPGNTSLFALKVPRPFPSSRPSKVSLAFLPATLFLLKLVAQCSRCTSYTGFIEPIQFFRS